VTGSRFYAQKFGGHVFEVHFDTGAESTFMSYEALESMNIVGGLDDEKDWVYCVYALV